MPTKPRSIQLLERALEVVNEMEISGVSPRPVDMGGLTYQSLKLLESSKVVELLEINGKQYVAFNTDDI